MDFWLDALAFLLRWLHVVAAIAWIGESFYFVALDRGLRKPAGQAPGLFGESWSVHGGGFYLKQKFMPAPAELPADLHWSKWKSYTTWLSGFALLAAVYFASPNLYLVDPSVLAMSNREAIAAACLLLLGTWLIYDLACTVAGFRDGLLSVLVLLLSLGVCLLCAELFAGRAAFLLAGAALATVMSANVFFVIIPGQKRLVAALSRGEPINPLDGQHGKQRSVHNTYFTLPVVFAMLSTHYGPAYTHAQRGWVLFGFMLAAALIREFFVRWHSGERAYGLLGAGFALVLGLLAWIAPAPAAAPTAVAVPPTTAAIAVIERPVTADIEVIMRRHCTNCHARRPSVLAVAPKGLFLEQDREIEANRALILKQVVETRLMPLGNLTQISEAERETIRRWATP